MIGDNLTENRKPLIQNQEREAEDFSLRRVTESETSTKLNWLRINQKI